MLMITDAASAEEHEVHMPDLKIANAEVNTLDELARRICEGHQAVVRDSLLTLAQALNTGDDLIAARSRVSTGWHAWLEANCSALPLSTARLYAHLAKHRVEIEAAAAKFSGLSLRAARALIKKTNRPSKPKLKQKKISLTQAWANASEAERAAFFENLSLEEFLAAAPSEWIAELDRRASKQTVQRLKARCPNTRVRHLKNNVVSFPTPAS
jgi:hypothetical protein